MMRKVSSLGERRRYASTTRVAVTITGDVSPAEQVDAPAVRGQSPVARTDGCGFARSGTRRDGVINAARRVRLPKAQREEECRGKVESCDEREVSGLFPTAATVACATSSSR
jgi:hypothetical protein